MTFPNSLFFWEHEIPSLIIIMRGSDLTLATCATLSVDWEPKLTRLDSTKNDMMIAGVDDPRLTARDIRWLIEILIHSHTKKKIQFSLIYRSLAGDTCIHSYIGNLLTISVELIWDGRWWVEHNVATFFLIIRRGIVPCSLYPSSRDSLVHHVIVGHKSRNFLPRLILHQLTTSRASDVRTHYTWYHIGSIVG